MYTQTFKSWSRVLAVILMIGLAFSNFNGSPLGLSSKAYAAAEADQTIQ